MYVQPHRAAGVLEGQVALAYGSTLSASMQQLIDCVEENSGWCVRASLCVHACA